MSRSLASVLAVASVAASLLAGCRGAAPAASGTSSANTANRKIIALATLAPDEGGDRCRAVLLDQLSQEGFEPGRNLEVRAADAQGEMANATMMMQNFESQGDLDAIVAFTTPVLTAAINSTKRKPVVFAFVTDPLAAGAGASRTDHLPNVTGVGSFPAVEETVDVIEQIVPGIRTVGTIFNSGEANSMKILEVGRPLFAQRGITLVEVSVASTNEVFQATQALAARGAQAIWLGSDNTVYMAFDAVAKAAADARLPIISNESDQLPRGVIVSVGTGLRSVCIGTGRMVARVLRGENPKDIPIEEISDKEIQLNREVAKRLGITFPAALLAKETK